MNSLKIRDPSQTRLPTIGSFSLLGGVSKLFWKRLDKAILTLGAGGGSVRLVFRCTEEKNGVRTPQPSINDVKRGGGGGGVIMKRHNDVK